MKENNKKFQIILKEKAFEKIIYSDKKISVLDIIKNYNPDKKREIIACYINNKYADLTDSVENDSIIQFIYLNNEIGLNIYRDTAVHILAYVIKNIFNADLLRIGPSIRYNYYFDIDKKIKIDKKILKRIESKMLEIIKNDIPIKKELISKETAINFYKKKKEVDKANLIYNIPNKEIKFYSIENFKEHCQGPLATSTGIIKKFKIIDYPPGFLLVFPKIENGKLKIRYEKPPEKLSKIFLETRNWYNEQGVTTIAQLNSIINENKITELITVSEALHEKKIAQIADIITKNKDEIKLILIAGPSASGKTTFSKRLSVQLRVNGIKPILISLDNYFLDREKTPKDEEGNYDFESIYALDLKLLNKHLSELLKGKKIMMPIYDFKIGKRREKRIPLQLEKDQIILIEGIHGLNEELTSKIPKKKKFKIYVSALTQLKISSYHRITTTDTRLLRRIVRDAKFRNHSALQTLRMWQRVRKGEEKYIFPFQEDADIMFNSALVYETAVLKYYVYNLLLQIPHNEPEYAEARRLIELLDYFIPITDKDVPKTSILREFIGGSSFKY
jgi:uridine kinase